MNLFQKWLDWFRNQSRWVQSVVIVGLCVLLIVGIWLSTFTYSKDTATGMVDSTGWMVGAFLKLLLVVVLIIGLAIVAKRWINQPGQSSSRQMKVVESLMLNPKRSLHIIKVGGQLLLIGATDQNISLISELDTAEIPGSFQTALNQASTGQDATGL